MTKQEVRDVLNNPKANFHYVIGLLTRYFLEDPVKSIMINSIVSSAKGKKNLTSIDLFKFFYEYAEDVVSKTRMSSSKYSNQMLLKSVWENAHIQNIVVSQVRKGYKMFPVSEEDFKEIKEQQRKERLKRHAALMRKAKAKKRAEKLAKEKAAQKPQEKGVETAQKPREKGAGKKFTNEQLEQIEMLRRMKA